MVALGHLLGKPISSSSGLLCTSVEQLCTCTLSFTSLSIIEHPVLLETAISAAEQWTESFFYCTVIAKKWIHHDLPVHFGVKPRVSEEIFWNACLQISLFVKRIPVWCIFFFLNLVYFLNIITLLLISGIWGKGGKWASPGGLNTPRIFMCIICSALSGLACLPRSTYYKMIHWSLFINH